MKLLYCRDSFVPIDQIASVFIDSIGYGDRRVIRVRDVSGRHHTYADTDNNTDARNELHKLARWLVAGDDQVEP